MPESNLWKEEENPVTGKSSITTHKLRIVKQGCKPNEHYYEISKDNNREVICQKCGLGANYIPGAHSLKNGRLTKITTS